MTDDEIRALLDAATPGPWLFRESWTDSGKEYLGSGVLIDGYESIWFEHTAEIDIPNARLIATAPALANAALEARAEAAALRDRLAVVEKALSVQTSGTERKLYSRVGHNLAEASWHVYLAGFRSRDEAEQALAALQSTPAQKEQSDE